MSFTRLSIALSEKAMAWNGRYDSLDSYNGDDLRMMGDACTHDIGRACNAERRVRHDEHANPSRRVLWVVRGVEYQQEAIR